MKRVILLILFMSVAAVIEAQEMQKTMEARAREMVRVIGLNDKAAWKKFVEENYTQTLIEKPMQAKKQSSGGDSGSSSQKGTVEGKVAMYEMLHNDFGNGKIASLKTIENEVKMVVNSVDMSGTFTLKFAKEKPWLIDGIGVEVGN